ncbi:MAG: MotA/TolQ/ExbB proton channel family protein [Myxococcota bacterium]
MMPKALSRVGWILGFSLLTFPASLFAQEEASQAASEEASGGGSTVLAYLTDGGWMMYVILGASIVGMIVFLERAVDLFLQRRLNAEGVMGKVLRAVETGQWDEAIRHCRVRTKHPLVDVVRAGLISANQRERDVERAMENAMLQSLKPLSKRIGIIALLANAATLLGLLGTILGLITAFNSVAAASAAERQTALADGISQAMYTTFFGILVAVPLLFFHHFVSRRQEVILMEVESAACRVLVTLARLRQDSRSGGQESSRGV